MANPTVHEIIKAYLVLHGFDGLFDDAGCGCKKEDLFPCGDPLASCRAGHNLVSGCGDHDYYIGIEE